MAAAAVVMVVSHPVNMSLRRYAKKERGRGEREGGKMAAEIKFLRSLEKMPIAAHLLRSTKDGATGLVQ